MSMILLSCFLVIQVIDLNQTTTNLYTRIDAAKSIDHTVWKEVVQDFDRIIVIPPFTQSAQNQFDFIDFSLLALNNSKETSAGYAARYPFEEIQSSNKTFIDQIRGSEPDPEALYVFSQDSFYYFQDEMNSNLLCYELEDYFVCSTRGRFDFLESYHHGQRDQDKYIKMTIDEFFEAHKESLILLTAYDEASNSLSDAFKQNMKIRGSGLIELPYRSAYSGVFFNDRLIKEVMDTEKPVELLLEQGIKIESGAHFFTLPKDIFIRSEGFGHGGGSFVLIAGENVLNGARGLNAVVLNSDLEVLATAIFDTHQTETGLVTMND
jgi:hypothetical protein